MSRHSHNKHPVIVITILLCSIMLVGCEANQHESTFQREQQAGHVVDRSDDYSKEEYSSVIFADQPSEADELGKLQLATQGESLTIMSSENKSVGRDRILEFCHVWMQYSYTYSKASDFDKLAGLLTDELSQSFSYSKLSQQKLDDAKLWNVISDIRSVYFYDQYCKTYITQSGEEVIRIKAEVVVKMTGDEEYFVLNQHVNKGDVPHEMYFYLYNTDSMPIYGIYETTSNKKSVCWYTSQGIERDTSELIGDEFSILTNGIYKYRKSNVSLPTADKNKVHRRITDFIAAFFDKNQNSADVSAYGIIGSDVIEAHENLMEAIKYGEIEYDQNYVSYSMEMAFPDIRLYEYNSKTYYVVKESVMLSTSDSTIAKYRLDNIESGLWKYSIYFVFDADDRDFHIIRIEIHPESGPYESVGDLDEG